MQTVLAEQASVHMVAEELAVQEVAAYIQLAVRNRFVDRLPADNPAELEQGMLLVGSPSAHIPSAHIQMVHNRSVQAHLVHIHPVGRKAEV